jgi:hypothetical protein
MSLHHTTTHYLAHGTVATVFPHDHTTVATHTSSAHPASRSRLRTVCCWLRISSTEKMLRAAADLNRQTRQQANFCFAMFVLAFSKLYCCTQSPQWCTAAAAAHVECVQVPYTSLADLVRCNALDACCMQSLDYKPCTTSMPSSHTGWPTTSLQPSNAPTQPAVHAAQHTAAYPMLWRS